MSALPRKRPKLSRRHETSRCARKRHFALQKNREPFRGPRRAMRTLEPIALSPREATQLHRRQQAHSVAPHSCKKIAARKAGVRTLVDVASLRAYYESLPLKTDHAPHRVRLSDHRQAA